MQNRITLNKIQQLIEELPSDISRVNPMYPVSTCTQKGRNLVFTVRKRTKTFPVQDGIRAALSLLAGVRLSPTPL